MDAIENLDAKRMAEASFEIVQLLAIALVAKGHFTNAELRAIFEPMEEKAIQLRKKESAVLLQSLTAMLTGDGQHQLMAVVRRLMLESD
jgi:hypothetical protein